MCSPSWRDTVIWVAIPLGIWAGKPWTENVLVKIFLSIFTIAMIYKHSSGSIGVIIVKLHWKAWSNVILPPCFVKMQLEMFSAYIASNFAGHLVHVPLVVSILVYVTCDSSVFRAGFQRFPCRSGISEWLEWNVGGPCRNSRLLPFLCHVCIFCVTVNESRQVLCLK